MSEESKIQSDIVRYLNNLVSIDAYVVVTKVLSRSGVPDIIASLDGRFVGIEVKRPGKKPTDLQWDNIDSINSGGGLAFYACSVQDVNDHITGHTRRNCVRHKAQNRPVEGL